MYFVLVAHPGEGHNSSVTIIKETLPRTFLGDQLSEHGAEVLT